MPKGSGRTKNLRYGAQEDGWVQTDKAGLERHLEELFAESDKLGMPDGVGVDDLEDVYEIDIEHIGGEANTLAASNVQNLLRLYNNKEFTDEHPDFKRRIDTEIESLRKLYKMAKINEVVHDHLVNSIAKNPGNASLYMALDRLQGKMLSVDAKIREQIGNFNKIITGYQMELSFARDNDISNDGSTSELEDGSVLSRGNKAFIEQMKSEQKDKESTGIDPNNLDPDNLPTGWNVDEDTGDVYDEDTGEVVGHISKDL